jgi:hypothetical protein
MNLRQQPISSETSQIEIEARFQIDLAAFIKKQNEAAAQLINVLKKLTGYNDIRININDTDGAYIDLTNRKAMLGIAAAFVNNPPLEPTQMFAYASIVRQTGLAVRIIPPKTCIGITPAKLFIQGEMEKIISVISEHLKKKVEQPATGISPGHKK